MTKDKFIEKWIKWVSYSERGNLAIEMGSDLEEIEKELSEDNWIKIESEDDLPKKDIDCFYITKHGDICIGRYVLEHFRGWKRMFTIDGVIAFGFGYVTHYQPIIKPNLPLT